MKSYTFSYMEDFKANEKISEKKVLCKLKCIRSHAPSQGSDHTDLYETGSVYFQRCYLTVEIVFK